MAWITISISIVNILLPFVIGIFTPDNTIEQVCFVLIFIKNKLLFIQNGSS